MNLIDQLYNVIPDHLSEEIVLYINPEHIQIAKNIFNKSLFDPRSKYGEKLSDDFYALSFSKFSTLPTPSKYLDSLVKALKLKYYDLFDLLFKNYPFPYRKRMLNKLLDTSVFIGNDTYINKFLSMGADYGNSIGYSAGASGSFDIIYNFLKEKNYDPYFLNKNKDHYFFLDDVLRGAAEYGHIDIVKHFIYKYSYSYSLSDFAWPAASAGNTDMVNLLLKTQENPKLSTSINDLAHIIKKGDIDMIKLMVPLLVGPISDIHYDTLYLAAAESGNIEMFKIIQSLLPTNPTFSEDIFLKAVESGNIDLIKFIQRLAPNNYNFNFNQALSHASKNGHLNIIRWILKIAPKNYKFDLNQAFIYAAFYGQIEIINFLLTEFPNYKFDFNKALYHASGGGHLNLVRWILKIAPKNYKFDFNKALYHASGGAHLDVVRLILDITPKNYKFDFNPALYNASNGGHLDVVRLILDIAPKNYKFNYDKAISEVFYPIKDEIDILETSRLLINSASELDFNRHFNYLTSKIYPEIAQFIVDIAPKNIIDFGSALVSAIRYKNYDMIKIILNSAPKNYNFNYDILFRTIPLDMIEFIIENAPKNYNFDFDLLSLVSNSPFEGMKILGKYRGKKIMKKFR